ncbi:hypothetical protein SRABI06_02974 [Pseudomonas brassicacearum]|nr:hypothetical protein SRABI06_02974 [Pseudomonas brassicacearum]
MSCVGADECNEAAIFPQTLESQAKDQKIKRSKDQKIAGFASSYRAQRLLPRHEYTPPQPHFI